MTKGIDFDIFKRDNKTPPIKSKPEETQRRKVMGLQSQQDRDQDCQTTDNSKTAQKRRRKARHPKIKLCKFFGQDRPANRKANTGKPVGAKLWV